MNEVRIYRPAPLSVEVQARLDRARAESAADRAEQSAVAVAEVRCPRCKAEPAQPCRWYVRHSEIVHTPRMLRAGRIVRRRRGES